jgi:hypothetical protein
MNILRLGARFRGNDDDKGQETCLVGNKRDMIVNAEKNGTMVPLHEGMRSG